MLIENPFRVVAARRGRFVVALALIGALFSGAALAQSPRHQSAAPAQKSGDAATAAEQTPARPGSAEAPPDASGNTSAADTPVESQSAPTIKPAQIVAAQIDEQRAIVNEWKALVDRIEAALRREDNDDRELAGMRREMEPIRDQGPALIAQLQERVRIIEARIAQLGEPPADGQPPETPAVQAEREALNAALTDVRGVMTQARLIVVQADQLESRIAQRRRDSFAARLAERASPPFDPALLRDVVTQLPKVASRLNLLLGEGARAIVSNITPAPDRSAASINTRLSIIVISIAIGIALTIGGRRKLAELYRRVPRDSAPGALEKYAGATWLTVVDALVPIISLYMVMAAVNGSGFFPDRLYALLRGAVVGVGFYLFLRALIIAVLAPRVPSWRLVAMPQAQALNLTRVLLTIAAVVGINEFLDTVFSLIAAPLQIEVARSGWLALVIAGLGFWALRIIAHGRTASDHNDDDMFTGRVAESTGRPSAWFRVLFWSALAAVAAASLLGYVALAAYGATQIVFASSIVALTIILVAFTDELASVLVQEPHGPGETLAYNFGLSRAATDQIIVVISGIFRLFLIITAAVLVMVPWGFDTWQLNSWVRSAFFGIQVGEITISPATILSALAVFIVALVAMRSVKGWIDNKYLPRTNLDMGLKSSVSTAFGYVGLVIAAAIAISFAGFDLANLAIVAGALSLGIGFGLQSIVNNFVSGLILLAERPVKVGDWISVGGEQGYVRRIKVRATEIQTFDRAMVVVPNSDLISGTVKNMMLSDRTGRIMVNIGVSYDSDADRVHDILVETARSHPGVLAFPEPKAYFMDFGASSLDFRLYAYLAEVDNSLSTASDLRYVILRRFREEGIEIPFPQTDIHVRGAIDLAAPKPPTSSTA